MVCAHTLNIHMYLGKTNSFDVRPVHITAEWLRTEHKTTRTKQRHHVTWPAYTLHCPHVHVYYGQKRFLFINRNSAKLAVWKDF